jgi:hypothetical protein
VGGVPALGRQPSELAPDPVCVEATPEAETALEEFRALADDRYAEAEDRDDPAGMAVWARAYEKARKLALVYAASENHLQMRIDEPAVQWAWRFVDYQTGACCTWPASTWPKASSTPVASGC